jgi:hypothetical protein
MRELQDRGMLSAFLSHGRYFSQKLNITFLRVNQQTEGILFSASTNPITAKYSRRSKRQPGVQ